MELPINVGVSITNKKVPTMSPSLHPDHPPVIYQVEIGKVVEKADSLQQQHFPCLSEPSSLYLVKVNSSTDLSA